MATQIVNELEKVGLQTIISGLSAGTLSQAFGFGGSLRVPYLGFSIPASVYFGLTVAGASGVQKASRDTVLPLITEDATPETVAYMIAPLITGSSTVGIDMLVHYLNTGQMTSNNTMLNTFMIGASSELIAQYASQPLRDMVEFL